MLSPGHLLLQTEQHQLLHRTGAPALRSPCLPFSRLTLISPHSSYLRGCRAEHSTSGGVSPERSGTWESPSLPCWPLPFWCSPGHGWFCGLQAMLSFLSINNSKSSSGLLSSPLCIFAWDCSDPRAGPWTWPCWTSCVLYRPTSQTCPGPPGWHPYPPTSQPDHMAWCHRNIGWGCTWSAVYVVNKMLKSTP